MTPIALLVLGARLLAAPLQPAEVVADIRVHGNHLTPDAEIVTLAGVSIGAPVGPSSITEIAERLRASKKFVDVQVLKRFASIADPTRIVIVIIVNEGPVRIDVPDDPSEPLRIVKRRGWHNLMFMPILDGEDGYGLTYGVRLAFVGPAGSRSRLSFPLSWGGLKQAGAEWERNFAGGPLSRIEFGGGLSRQRNPAFEENDDRRRLFARAERGLGPMRAGAGVGWERVSFAGLRDTLQTVAGDLTYDTRVDPLFPRNAVYAVASVERIGFASGGSVNRTRLDAQGFLGFIGQTVLVGRVLREDADRSLPDYLKSLLGGTSNLRGFKAGAFSGDTLVAASAELRVPLSSPLSVARLGVSAFFDTGAAYDKGQRLANQRVQRAVGGGLWVTAAVVQMSLSVAHGFRSGTRVNFGLGVSF